jgi:hypothetical protein
MTGSLVEKAGSQLWELSLPVRGSALSLQDVKKIFVELGELSKKEGLRISGELTKLDDEAEEAFATRKTHVQADAFKLTVSIIGGADNETKYAEDESIFDSADLPSPINAIFFTNETSYRRNAAGNLPENRFQLLLDFRKPPIFDPNPLVSEPTVNASQIQIKARDVTYFRAAQSILTVKLKRNLWYAGIHEKFVYDVGMWVLCFPYVLYSVTHYADKLLPETAQYHTFRPAFFIYGIGLGMVLYRTLFGYMKWAFPVNVLRENTDAATKHRWFFGALLLAVIGNGASHLFGF